MLAPDPPEAIELLWISDGDEVTNYGNITSEVAKMQVRGIRNPRDLRLQLPDGDLVEPEVIASVNPRLGWYELNFRLPRLEPGEIELTLSHSGLGAIQSATVTLG